MHSNSSKLAKKLGHRSACSLGSTAKLHDDEAYHSYHRLLYGSHLRVAADKLSSFLVELRGYQPVTQSRTVSKGPVARC